MPSRWTAALAAPVASVLLVGCGGGGGSSAPTPPTTAAAAAPGPTTATTRSPIEGVQTYAVEAGHREGTISYPQTPPVGGLHNPVWQPCTFYDRPVPNEMAVHSLEHGAIWLTYRPDLPPADVEALAILARSRKYVLVSPWPEGLPAPLVATAWGRQLALPAATDPRLAQFVQLYVNQAPEPNAPC
jgi:hypothetical protein